MTDTVEFVVPRPLPAAPPAAPVRRRTMADRVIGFCAAAAALGVVAFLLTILALTARWVAAITGIWPLS